jgi:hypothetical protein
MQDITAFVRGFGGFEKKEKPMTQRSEVLPERQRGRIPSFGLQDIKCDRCGNLAHFDTDGGNCEDCGDDLCADCALWVLTYDERTICTRCCDKRGKLDDGFDGYT